LKKNESKRLKKWRKLEQDSHHIDNCYLDLPEDMIDKNPLNIENIKEKQDQDADFRRSATRHPEWYSRKDINSFANVSCYTKPNDDPSNWKITLPNKLIEPTIQWYHQVTGHPGSKRLYEHIRQRYNNRDMHKRVDRFNCDHCQRNKLEGRGYELLPEREVQSIPFEECAVDLIGPWIIQVCGNPYEFSALTAIDTVTNLVELVRIDDKTPDNIARKYAQC